MHGIKVKTRDDVGRLVSIMRQFMPFLHSRLGYDQPVTVKLVSDPENAENPLGKTAYYSPDKMEIVLFTDKRHPKDILRSLAHEMVHHTQNCRGEFDNVGNLGKYYAQEDDHMRKMEEEAYKGTMLLRDFEDNLRMEENKMNESKIRDAVRTAINKVLSENAQVEPVEEELEESVFAPNHYCIHHGGVQMEGEIKLGKAINHNWNESQQRVTEYDMELEDGTIVEGVKAEDILVTEASLASEHMHSVAKRDKKDVDEAHCGKRDDGSLEEDLDENAFNLAADAANDAGKKEFEFPKGSGKMHPVTIKQDIKARKKENLKEWKNNELFDTLMEKWCK